jgi:1-acyl-sn-glycerol-3-phosphate acyltransferase
VPNAYGLAKTLLTPALRRCFPVRVDGLHLLPRRGPAIIAANHLSVMDSIFLEMVSPRPITFVAKAEYFDRWPTNWIFSATGQIPLRRGNGFAARRALDAAEAALADGHVVGIFPEGTRSRDGMLHRGNKGPARLALASGAPIVPVGLVGTDAVHAPGDTLPHPFRPVSVRFGQPRTVVADDGSRGSGAALRTATEDLMLCIASLSGQEYEGRALMAGAVA